MKKVKEFFKLQKVDYGLYSGSNIRALYNQIKLLKVGSCKMDLNMYL